jgi:hypothetical protein
MWTKREGGSCHGPIAHAPVTPVWRVGEILHHTAKFWDKTWTQNLLNLKDYYLLGHRVQFECGNTWLQTTFRAHTRMQVIWQIHQHLITEGRSVCLVNWGRQRLGKIEQIVTVGFITIETKPLYTLHADYLLCGLSTEISEAPGYWV